MLTATNISNTPERSGIDEFLSADRAAGTSRGEPARFRARDSARAHGQDDMLDSTVNRNLSEAPDDTPTSIGDSPMLSQEAVHINDKLLTGARNVIVAGTLGLGGMLFMFSLIFAAVLSRLE